MCSVSRMKTRDEVGPADDVVWIEKAKCAILECWDELETVQPFGFPPSPVRLVKPEPADPKDVHPDFVRHCQSMENVESIYPKDLCIRIWVSFIPGEGHDVGSVLHVHPVLAPSEIICRVIDIHAVPLLEAVFGDVEPVPVLCRECRCLSILLFLENAGEEVILEFHDEVLDECQFGMERRRLQLLTFRAGSPICWLARA